MLQWLVFVGIAVVLGWRLNPRFDEIAFVGIGVPALATLAYAGGCLILASLRLLWPICRDRLTLSVRFAVFFTRQCISSRSRTTYHRLS